MKRALSGIQPSGQLHLGNYFGAIRQFLELQHDHEAIFFIADYHSMTSLRDGEERRRLTLGTAMDYLAFGLDPEQCVLYRQSDLPEVTELTWLFSTVTSMGLLERAHAYKDKIAQGAPAVHGLFAYPVLMAADILIFNPSVVPVGRDQKQHVEIARDIAGAFNSIYGHVFELPKAHIREDVALVPGTDGRKMSKSYGNTIQMLAPDADLKRAVMGIVTDATPLEDPKDTSTPLFQLWGLFASEEERAQMEERARAGGLGYGEVKKDLLARLQSVFGAVRERRAELEESPAEVEMILAEGARRARAIAGPILAAARDAAGLGRAL